MESALDFYSRKITGFKSMTFEERRAEAKKANLEDKQHTKTTLKEVFRVKPANDAKSQYQYKNDFGTTVQCFTLAQCIPMRALTNKPRSDKQKATTDNLIKHNHIHSPANQAAKLALSMIEEDVVVIDTETTDLDGVVIQISLVSSKSREVLYHSNVFTDKEISQDAFEVNRICQSDLDGAPPFEVVVKEINAILGDRQWTAFNLPFDKSVLMNSVTPRTEQADCQWFDRVSRCVMYGVAVPAFGSTNRHGTISLADTLDYCGLSFGGRAHNASVDAIATVDILHHIAHQAISE